jgi:serine/threonine protein kinase
MAEHPDHWRAVDAKLDQALELPEEGRGAWLERLNAEAPTVAIEVRRLLDIRADASFDHFLEGSAAPVALTAAASAADLGGRRVGPYIIESELGRGGMGSVWLASRADGKYEGKVAIKFLSAAWLGEAGQERFQREGQLLARLDHANIARLLDAGVMEGSQPYLVLEYVEGEHIDRYCDSRHLDIAARVKLFIDVLDAVAHAHNHLIIHRDLKPANVLVTNAGVVKLLDFGVARLLNDGELQTRAGFAMFTPEYAAPEQVLGATLTTATDVHALGLVLYVLLTGKHPFSGMTGTPADLVRHLVETDAQLPSAAVTERARTATATFSPPAARRAMSATGLGRTLRGDLDNIVAKALRKDPTRRYANAGAFADDLRRFLSHQPVTARPDTMSYRTAKFMRRHRGSVASGAVLLITIIVAFVVTTLQMREARAQRDQALFQSRRAESANEFLNALLQTDALSRTSAERLNLGRDLLERQYADDAPFAGRMLVMLGRQFRGLTDTNAALAVYERAYQLGMQVQDLELMAAARCASADILSRSRVPGDIAGQLGESAALLAAVPNADITTRVGCYWARAQYEKQEQRYPEAIALLEEARDLMEQTGNTHRGLYTTTLTDLGGIYMETERFREAVDMAQVVVDTHDRFGRSGTAGRMTAAQNRATALASMGEIGASLAARTEMKARIRAVEGAGALPVYYPVNYAGILVRMKRAEQALAELDGVIEYARRTNNRYWHTQALGTIASAYIDLRRFADADAALAEATALLDAQPNANVELRSRIERTKAELFLAQGDRARARTQIDRVLAALHYPQQQPSRGSFFALLAAADVALAEQRAAEAEPIARAALVMADAVARGTETSADVGESLVRLAHARLAQGDRGDARNLLTRAERCLTNGYSPDHPLTKKTQDELAELAL